MDLKTRKLNLIEYLIHSMDEKLFDTIEAAITSKISVSENPFSEEQMIARALKADADYVAGRTMSIEQLEAEVKNW